ncbi:Uu.00g117680.m01.CDS01 [Anthostomella pinea]|uniref:Uu.00g117680.m01.CDS01 n=1 Tax=Anthostomella pinea TaxID=933095 RepID=A0AAI8VHB0_9PEZI|nr:Uu.00g117680.m01.CDS01 [Anthostomella pinea]
MSDEGGPQRSNLPPTTSTTRTRSLDDNFTQTQDISNGPPAGQQEASDEYDPDTRGLGTDAYYPDEPGRAAEQQTGSQLHYSIPDDSSVSSEVSSDSSTNGAPIRDVALGWSGSRPPLPRGEEWKFVGPLPELPTPPGALPATITCIPAYVEDADSEGFAADEEPKLESWSREGYYADSEPATQGKLWPAETDPPKSRRNPAHRDRRFTWQRRSSPTSSAEPSRKSTKRSLRTAGSEPNRATIWNSSDNDSDEYSDSSSRGYTSLSNSHDSSGPSPTRLSFRRQKLVSRLNRNVDRYTTQRAPTYENPFTPRRNVEPYTNLNPRPLYPPQYPPASNYPFSTHYNGYAPQANYGNYNMPNIPYNHYSPYASGPPGYYQQHYPYQRAANPNYFQVPPQAPLDTQASPYGQQPMGDPASGHDNQAKRESPPERLLSGPVILQMPVQNPSAHYKAPVSVDSRANEISFQLSLKPLRSDQGALYSATSEMV